MLCQVWEVEDTPKKKPDSRLVEEVRGLGMFDSSQVRFPNFIEGNFRRIKLVYFTQDVDS